MLEFSLSDDRDDGDVGGADGGDGSGADGGDGGGDDNGYDRDDHED